MNDTSPAQLGLGIGIDPLSLVSTPVLAVQTTHISCGCAWVLNLFFSCNY
eukprot:m.378699 g.378699  ORF g.378699 m.378699 type:complete len:50 (+) comp95120_c0_seq1:60-209(+)